MHIASKMHSSIDETKQKALIKSFAYPSLVSSMNLKSFKESKYHFPALSEIVLRYQKRSLQIPF